MKLIRQDRFKKILEKKIGTSIKEEHINSLKQTDKDFQSRVLANVEHKIAKIKI